MKLSQERIEEIQLTITVWQESGLNQVEFCRQENIHRATFQSWRKKYDPTYGQGYIKKRSSKTTDKFLSVRMSENIVDEQRCETSYDIELCYPNTVKLKCSSSLSTESLRTLINLY